MPAALRLLRPAFAALALGLAGSIAAEEALTKGSPFLPTGSAADPASAPGEMIEFAAVRTIGQRTEIDLYDTQGKKNHWIPLGGSAEGMSVLSYDARREQVVAKIGGADKILPLRKTRTNSGAPVSAAPAMSFSTPPPPPAPETMPAPAPTAVAAIPVDQPPANATPVAPAAPVATPETPAAPLSIARQEEEARMLVSDLLEIGMAQRKAYEEKQKQAADPNPTPPPPPATALAPKPDAPPSGE